MGSSLIQTETARQAECAFWRMRNSRFQLDDAARLKQMQSAGLTFKGINAEAFNKNGSSTEKTSCYPREFLQHIFYIKSEQTPVRMDLKKEILEVYYTSFTNLKALDPDENLCAARFSGSSRTVVCCGDPCNRHTLCRASILQRIPG